MRGTLQRRRGERVRIHKVAKRTDHRGNVVVSPTGEVHEVRGAITADRSARAEVPGQMHIDVVKLITNADLSDVSIWSRVEWAGRWWDLVAPPALRVGTAVTRHWTLTMRARVDDGGLPLTGWSDG